MLRNECGSVRNGSKQEREDQTMTTSINDACFERVKVSRQRTGEGGFPLPGPLACARYALTEGAEADDALLRAERSGDRRNNDRQRDACNEWGQAGYMILSGLISLPRLPELKFPDGNARPALWAYGATMGELAAFLQQAACGVPFDRSFRALAWAWTCWRLYAEAHRWDAVQLIDDTCSAFEAKHAAG